MSVLTPLLRTQALTDMFSDERLVQGMLDFEAALATVQARCGVIPAAAVAPIASACRASLIDLTELLLRQQARVIWRSHWSNSLPSG